MIDNPRAIALYQPRGVMFFTDWGKSPHIGRMGMDGSRVSRRILKFVQVY